jgi:gliding motility-associated-like protein
VTNINGCDSTFSEQVLVSLVPVADFDFVSDCFGAPTVFTDLSANNPGIYLWDFGDGTTLNGGPNEQHTYTTPGIYLVELQVLGSDSICSDSKIMVVNLADGADADFLIPAQICVNDVFNFYDNSSASIGTITSYEWIMSDGTTYNTANGTHAFNAPGVYQVTVNITTSDGCQATQTESIEVLPATIADFDWGSTCSNTVTQFTNTSTGGTTNWFWNFEDGTTSQTQFPTHVYTAEGDYSVMLIVQNLSGCADTIIQTVSIDPSPASDFTNDEVCYGDLTAFTNQSTITSGTIDAYEWIFGNNEGNSSFENPQYEFTTYAESHPVTLIATSDQGCTDTIIKTASLLPIVDFNINLDDQFGCAPVTFFFDNQSSINGAAILSYEWNFGDGNTSFQERPTHTFLEEGNYPVSLTVLTSTDCKIETTDGLNLTVFPSPTAAFDVNPPITSVSQAFIKITDESQGASIWEYDLGDGNYSNSPSLNHTFNEVGNYYITQFVQNEFGCTDSTQRAIEIQEDFILYVPNAFTPNDGNNRNDYFTWAISGYETFEMRVFNRWGELIFETKDPNGQWDGKYNGQKVRDGVYVWQVKALDLNGDERIITGHVSALK